QMDASSVKPERLASFLNLQPTGGYRAAQELYQKIALWVAGRHPEWGDSLASYFGSLLQRGEFSGKGLDLLPKYAHSEKIQGLIAEMLNDSRTKPDASRFLLETLSDANLEKVP